MILSLNSGKLRQPELPTSTIVVVPDLKLNPSGCTARKPAKLVGSFAHKAAADVIREVMNQRLDLVPVVVVEGIDADLVVKPFGWKGTFATLREFVGESLQAHDRVQYVVVIADDDIGPKGRVQRKFERTNFMFARHGLECFSTDDVLIQTLGDSRIAFVVVAACVTAVFCGTRHAFDETGLFLRGDGDAANFGAIGVDDLKRGLSRLGAGSATGSRSACSPKPAASRRARPPREPDVLAS